MPTEIRQAVTRRSPTGHPQFAGRHRRSGVTLTNSDANLQKSRKSP
jgi:hypothetical protein